MRPPVLFPRRAMWRVNRIDPCGILAALAVVEVPGDSRPEPTLGTFGPPRATSGLVAFT